MSLEVFQRRCSIDETRGVWQTWVWRENVTQQFTIVCFEQTWDKKVQTRKPWLTLWGLLTLLDLKSAPRDPKCQWALYYILHQMDSFVWHKCFVWQNWFPVSSWNMSWVMSKLVFTFQMLRPTCPVAVIIQNSNQQRQPTQVGSKRRRSQKYKSAKIQSTKYKTATGKDNPSGKQVGNKRWSSKKF